MTKLHHVKKARKDYPEDGINKGDAYYWWKFRHGKKHRSKTRPPRSALTQSSYYSQVFDLIDGFMLDPEAIQETIDDLKGTIEEIQNECQESLDNMPEQLQEGDTGQILQDRIDACEEAINNLDDIEIEDKEDYLTEYSNPEDAQSNWDDYIDTVSSDISNALENLEV